MHLQFVDLSSIISIATQCGIVFLAFVVRGFSGFGAGLVMTPLLAFFLDIKHAVVISVLLQLIGGGYLTRGTFKAMNRKVLRGVMLPSCIASLVGLYALTSLNFTILLAILGIVTIVFAIRMFVSPLKQYLGNLERRSFSISPLIGAMSGLLHGLYGAGGPPIVLFMSNEIPTKTMLRATLIIYFLTLDILLVGVYLLIPAVFTGRPMIDLTVLELGGWLLVPTFVGAAIGSRLQQRVSETVFRRGVALILISSGVFLLQRGISSL
jgi:uncharacterized membrane protein YfcA